ncbi:MAG: NAD(P)/FAD-dependent oxidoreductase [Acutalibacteraceae bacterium]
MIRLTDIKMPLNYTPDLLCKTIAAILRIDKQCITDIKLFKRSIDARKKNDIYFNITADISLDRNEKSVISRCKSSKATITEPYSYSYPKVNTPMRTRPIIAGAGPAGLFCALILAKCGCMPIIVERGKNVDERTKDVANFWKSGQLNTSSNVQFGEGGAGTFSDGKLNTGTKDIRSRAVLEEFVHCGAPEEILYNAKPHIGTDKLKPTIKNLRKKIISLGGEFLFETQLTDITVNNGKLTAVKLKKSDGNTLELETESLILAIGHSARDTFEMLYGKGAAIQAKPFSVGARIEHPRELIDKSQYGNFAGNKNLGAADYKLAVHLSNGRGVYTFCMCPGGVVVSAASESGRVCTNGMSEFARNAPNSNSALLVSVNPEDFGSNEPLAGMYLQRDIEEKAFIAGGGDYCAPVQRVEDFLKEQKSTHIGNVKPSYLPGVQPGDLDLCLPRFVTNGMREGIAMLDKKLNGFALPGALLTGAETRSSSPIRILRNENMQSINISGLYPCGEGAGYAGGIVSAAVDGVRCAEACINTCCNK